MVKRLFAVASGATMLGATAMGALAADLGNYPDMFVMDGKFDGFFVVGEKAASLDNLAAIDISTSMQYHAADAATTTTVEGDAWLAEGGAKKLEMANSNSTITGEGLYDIETFIGKGEMKALADGTFTTNGGSYGYTQYLYFDKANDERNEVIQYVENSHSDVTADNFVIKSGANIGEYRIEFTSSPQSSVQDTTGAANTAGTILDDFENTKISFFGKEYDIVLARRVNDGTPNLDDGVKLTLMGGATSGALLEGETTTVSIGADSYEVTLTYVDSTYAKFTVNGEQTNKLQVGDTYKLSNGKEIGVSEVLYQSYAGGIHSADFFLGASKLVLQDTDITNVASSSELQVGSETIDGANVIITGSDDNSTFQLTGIRVNMTAQDAYYVGTGSKLSSAIIEAGDEKELLFTNAWDIEYMGLTEATTHDIKLKSSNDRKYSLQFYDGDNNLVDFPLAYANTSTTLTVSEEASEKNVVLNKGFNITKNDYFAVSGGTAADGTARSYALQYKGSDKRSATSPQIKFKNLGTGETISLNVDTTATTNTTATLKLGGYSFAVESVRDKETADFAIFVALDSGSVVRYNAGDSPVGEIDIIDYYGAQIDFGNSLYGYLQANGSATTAGIGDRVTGINSSLPIGINVTSIKLNISVPNVNDYDNMVPSSLNFVIGATTTNEVTVNSFKAAGSVEASNPSITPEGEQNIGYGYTTMGAKWTYTSPSGSPNELTLAYPEKQRLPQVYVTAEGAAASTSSTGTLTAVTVVDATKLDSEVADVAAQNLIVVGGPCVNSVAAELMGNPADCAAGFTPGRAKVKLFTQTGGKMAMLVAGYSGDDTRLAGRVLAHRAADLFGDEVDIEGTTYSDATVSAPVVEVAAVEEVVEEAAADATTTE